MSRHKARIDRQNAQLIPMKIIFDQSAFHNDFKLLKGSRLLQLTQDGRITVYHTATFLDETLRMADSTRPGR
jgi:hypothetical protein